MDDILDSLIDALGDRLSDLVGSDQLGSVMEQATDALNHTLSNLDIEHLDPGSFDNIIDQVVSTLGLDPSTAADHLGTVSNLDQISFSGHGLDGSFTTINMNGPNTSGTIVENLDHTHKSWQGEFTGICWEECIASVKDAGKRMTCGYYA